jgi:hypothetical protein
MDPFDIALVMWKSFMQCSLEFMDRTAVPAAVAEAIRCLNAFRSRCRWLHISACEHTPPVYKIPSELSSLPEIHEWMYKAHTPKASDILGTIAADENRLVVNVSHSVADGRFLVGLAEHLCNPEAYGKRNTSLIASSAFDYFGKQIASHEPLPMCSSDEKLSRVFPKQQPVPQKKSEFLTHYLVEPTTNLKSYDPKTGKSRRMTELMWAALMLATAAFNENLMPAGLSTVIDLRRFLKEDQLGDNSAQNSVGAIQIHANMTPDRTIDEVTSEMRDQLEMKIRRGDWLGYLRAAYNNVWRPWRANKPVPGLGIQMSSIGLIRVRKPVTDALITMQCPGSQVYEGISFPNQSIRNLDDGTTKFVGSFQHTTQELHRDEGRLLAESVRYALKNIDWGVRIGDAVDAVRNFQSGFR